MDARQGTEKAQTPVIADLSQHRPISTRSRVVGENPHVNQAQDTERLKASHEAALRAKDEAEARLKEAYHNLPPETESSEPDHSDQNALRTSPPVNPQQLQSDLSLLATAGKVVDETIVGGFKFKMHTLTTTENNEAIAAASFASDQLLKVQQIQLSILARAVDAVNGVPLENLYTGSEKFGKAQKREWMVGSWQQALTTELFNFYDSMLQRSNAAFRAVTEQSDLLKN
jgi:hypothetical protein